MLVSRPVEQQLITSIDLHSPCLAFVHQRHEHVQQVFQPLVKLLDGQHQAIPTWRRAAVFDDLFERRDIGVANGQEDGLELLGP
ncbi:MULTISPECIES: hypothetical protein [Pseudomonas]|uniref:hypothetical protein n=1 Tax=Pseudomonas TaxID=286 RepID=UPI001CE41B16|nr:MULTISPECIES: hypothetical protein [Pseudomonas]CAH0650430.1 hypothetical protein PSNVIR_04724 [Pseudomonas sp. Nvir]